MQIPWSAGLLLLCSLAISAAACAQTASNGKSGQPVATVAGQNIYEEDLASAAQGQLLPLRTQEYDIKRKALDGLIEQKLLESAAKAKGLTTEQLLSREVDSKIQESSDAELEGYYLGLRDRINRPFADVKPQLRESLRQNKAQQARQDYLQSLRANSDVKILMSAPRVEVAYDPARVRGNPKAPVMIVEFSDYQCPYCHQVEPTIKAILDKYGDKVSIAYRDFPLRQMPTQAEISAEATHCALEQGKFWEYHDQLFTASKLEKDDLVGYARDLKLDDKRFASCLSSEKYKAAVDEDL